ncbi:hypothetical protein EHR01_15455 [Leptospira mtsangambouensis]|uniref:Tetratricopeptide repeat protein n=1 Tax=Leptospira mtsangambouensis TaxID=2484912 RepID=A0ABY2NWK5_9LEPT|nr:hypothetical protein [Leptospira mtsangambouensis]TGM72631.1 hypothetical protein EHR01_15455 [Leptospira mtsangambouensis]
MKKKTLILLFTIFAFSSLIPEENTSLSLDDFKSQLMELQSLIDNEKEFKNALNGFLNLKGKLINSKENDPYIIGLEISILKTALLSGNRNLAADQLNKLNLLPNSQFIHMEKFDKKTKGLELIFWEYGYTQPDLFFKFKHFTNYSKNSPDEKFNFIKSQALLYSDLLRGRLNGTSSTTTYGDQYVQLIYFDESIPNTAKLIFLQELANVLNGSAKGNALLSLALMHEKNENYKESEFCAKECINILQPIEKDRYYNEVLISKCKNLINK